MSSSTLYRASGLALLLGAVLLIVGFPLSFVFPPDTPITLVMIGVWISGAVLVQLGLPGIVARQAKQSGWLGFVGFLLTFSGGFLIVSFFAVLDLIIFPWLDVHAPLVSAQFFTANAAVNMYFAVASSLFGVGGLLLGIATIRARVFPRWTGLLLILGLVSLGAFVYVFIGFAAVLGWLGLGGMGYVLVTAKGEAIPQPALAP